VGSGEAVSNSEAAKTLSGGKRGEATEKRVIGTAEEQCRRARAAQPEEGRKRSPRIERVICQKKPGY